MSYKEKTLEKNYVYNGKILNLRADSVEVKGGLTSVREIVEHGGGSAVFCENEGKILLVKQFRYAYGEELYELPAGKLEKGEPPEVTALRELEEECGIKAERAELMFEIYPSPGYTNEIIRIYRAEGFSSGEKHLDADEDVTAEWFSKKRLKEMVENGEIKDAKTLVALLRTLY